MARRHVPGPHDLADRLAANLVAEARRRGKYLWLVLRTPDGSEQGLITHLGMSGQLLVEEPGAPEEKHLHARFTFADDGPELRFVDQRTFGGMALVGPRLRRASPRRSPTSPRTPSSPASTSAPSSPG